MRSVQPILRCLELEFKSPILWFLILATASGVLLGFLPEPAVAFWPYDIQQIAKPGRIHHVSTGDTVTFDELLDVVQSSRVVYVGERHGHPPAHRIQARLVRGLHRRGSTDTVIGFELFRSPRQEWLNGWLESHESLDQYIRRTRPGEPVARVARWYEKVLYYARIHGLKLVALNPPREMDQWLRQQPLHEISPERRRRVPTFGPVDPYQRRMVREVFQEHVKTGGDFEAFYRVHRLWEEHMARRIVNTLTSPSRMVVLTGSFHVRYGFGVPKAVFRRRPLSQRIVLPEPLPDSTSGTHGSESSTRTPLLPADFVWWIPPPNDSRPSS